MIHLILLAWAQGPADPVVEALPNADGSVRVRIERAPTVAPEATGETDPPAPALGAIELTAPPRRGAEITLRVERSGARPAAGATVRVRWWPDLPYARTEDLGIADARGAIAWRPTEVGLAELNAGPDVAPLRVVVADAGASDAAAWIAGLGFAALGAAWMARQHSRSKA